MAVRFQQNPRPESRRPRSGEHVAEVIELRTRLVRPTLTEHENAPAPEQLSRKRRQHLQSQIDEVLETSEGAAGEAAAEAPLEAGSIETMPLETALPETALPESALNEAKSSDTPIATEDAVRLLAKRALSSGEVRRELELLGHGVLEIDTAIFECEAALYLDDLGLARAQVDRLRSTKRMSAMQIRRKLGERRLPDHVIEAVLSDLNDEDELELLGEAARSRAEKLRDLDRAVAERRLLGYLARRGWSGADAFQAVRDALDAQTSSRTVRFR